MASTMAGPAPPVPAPTGRAPSSAWWRDRRTRYAAAAAVAAGSGVGAAALIPRGPATGLQVALLMFGALAVGGLAGWATRSRWSILFVPVLHLIGFELARASAFGREGPTFDPPRLGVALGVLVFLAVHVMYALVVSGPMVLGAVCTYRPWRRPGVAVRGVLALVLALAVVGLAVQLIVPGRVAPVLDADGRAVPGSVATMEKVRLGGVDQWVSIRGTSVDNPVLLHLSGGPGSSDVGWVRTFNRPLEDAFTVVVWEQRGVGKSYPAIDPTSTFTLDQLVADGVELTRWLAEHFDEQRIYLTGNSWGSSLGVLMVQRHPELYWAYVGTGQMVSQRETDRVLYHQLLDYADGTGDAALGAQLRAYGEPPYRDVFAYAMVMEYYDAIEPYPHSPAFDRARGPSGFFPDEYSLLDTWNELRGFADMGGLIYPQLQGLDFRDTVPSLDVPVYFMQGRHELTARSRFADEWIEQVQAPIKRVYEFTHSGHNPDAEEPERFNDLLVNTVLPETYRR